MADQLAASPHQILPCLLSISDSESHRVCLSYNIYFLASPQRSKKFCESYLCSFWALLQPASGNIKMDLFQILAVFTLAALVMVTSFTLGTQQNAEAEEKKQEDEQENDRDIELGLQEGGDMGADISAPDEQGPTSLQVAMTPNRHEETRHMESPVMLLANLETEEQEEEQIGEAEARLDIQLPVPVALQEAESEVYAKVLKFGSKIGIWATGISVPGIIAILASANRNQKTSLSHSLLLLASTLAMLASFISGGVLLIFPLSHVEIFSPSDPKSATKIRIIIGVAIGSMALGVSFVTALVLQNA